MTGRRIGRWLVIGESERRGAHGEYFWRCRCDCGTERDVYGVSLRRPKASEGCGCLRPVSASQNFKTHGKSRTAEYNIWCSMKGRCYNPRVDRYSAYGGRGIRVCDRWRDSFENFLADIGPRPTPKHSIDRIDVDGNYEPENCRWVTYDVQVVNTRRNRHITFRGETRTLSQWSAITGLKRETIARRLDFSGWTVEDALTAPTWSQRSSVRTDGDRDPVAA